MPRRMLIVEQKAQILPILELLIEAKEEHLLECFGLMLMYYSKFRTMSTQMPLSSIDESSVMQDQAGANVGQFVVLTEMGGTRRMYLKTRISRNMFKTSLEDLKRLVTRQPANLEESVAIVVEMRAVANSLGVVFAPYEGIADTVNVMHRYCKLLNDMLEQRFPKARQESADAADQAADEGQQGSSQQGTSQQGSSQRAAGAAAAAAAAGEQFAAAATDQMHVLTI